MIKPVKWIGFVVTFVLRIFFVFVTGYVLSADSLTIYTTCFIWFVLLFQAIIGLGVLEFTNGLSFLPRYLVDRVRCPNTEQLKTLLHDLIHSLPLRLPWPQSQSFIGAPVQMTKLPWWGLMMVHFSWLQGPRVTVATRSRLVFPNLFLVERVFRAFEYADNTVVVADIMLSTFFYLCLHSSTVVDRRLGNLPRLVNWADSEPARLRDITWQWWSC